MQALRRYQNSYQLFKKVCRLSFVLYEHYCTLIALGTRIPAAQDAHDAEVVATRHLESLQAQQRELQERAGKMDTHEIVLVVATKLETVNENVQATKDMAERSLTNLATLGDEVTTVQQEVARIRTDVENKFMMLRAETQSLKMMLKKVLRVLTTPDPKVLAAKRMREDSRSAQDVMAGLGVGAWDLRVAGFSAAEVMVACDFSSVVQVMSAGFSKAEAVSAGAREDLLPKVVGTDLTIPDEWLVEACKILGQKPRPRLLYRASRHGWRCTDFHRLCDKQGATLTVIKCSEGNIFGGYTDQHWDAAGRKGKYEASSHEWLFVLRCRAGLPPTQMHVEPGHSSAIYQSSDQVVRFGSNHDLAVYDQPNANTNSYYNIGSAFSSPPGESGNTFITGSSSFKAAEIEVYAIT